MRALLLATAVMLPVVAMAAPASAPQAPVTAASIGALTAGSASVPGGALTYNTVTIGGVSYVVPTAFAQYAPLASPTFTGTITSPALKLTGSQAASTVLAAPTGAAGAPTQRQLAVADISGAAPLASPGLTGTPTTPIGTPLAGGTQIAAQGYADAAVAAAMTTGSQSFTSSGTWTKRSGASTVCVIAVGLGGNGGPGTTISSSSSGSGGGGGGGAEYVSQCFPAALIASSVTVTVPAQSTPVSSGTGVAHSAATFGSYLTAYSGGDGGPASSGAISYGGNSASVNTNSNPSTSSALGSGGYYYASGGAGAAGGGGSNASSYSIGSGGGGCGATGTAYSGGGTFNVLTGGGAGGGLSSGTALAGSYGGINGLGGATGGAVGGGAGTKAATTWPIGLLPAGGGGGGGNGSGIGGAGAAAAGYGAGGGGGGSGTGGGGLGGQGGASIIIVSQS